MIKRKNKKSTAEQVKEVSKKKIKKDKKANLIPTGIDILDSILMGGIPAGKILNLVGDKSTGKTFFALEIIAWAKRLFKKKLNVTYDDCESGFSFDTKEMYGYEIIKPNQEPSNSVEEFGLNLYEDLGKQKAGEFLIYVLDSLDGVSSESEIKRDQERMKAIKNKKKIDGTYGMEKSKFMSEFFRLRSRDVKDKKCLLIIISQVRQNVNATLFSKKQIRSGGKALDFYAYACLWLAEVQKYKKKGRTIGVCVKIKAEKAKIRRPFREGFVDIIFDYGVDNIGSNIKFLYDLKTDKGQDKDGIKTRKLDWDGEEFTIRKLTRYIEKNNLEEELTQKVKYKWEEIEDSIASKRKPKWV